MSVESTADVVDAHAHFWAPHPAAARYVHPGDRPISADDLIHLMDAAGVARTLQVTRVFAADDSLSVAGAARHPQRFRVLGRPGPRAYKDADAWRQWSSQVGLVGIRLFAAPFDGRLLGPARSAFWGRVSSDRVPVSIYAPGHLPDLIRLAAEQPEVAFVLDHAGAAVAHDIPADERLAEWPLLVDAAALPNVRVKASALPEATGEHAPHFPKATELLLELVELFGAQRVMWGSNFTPAGRTGSYGELVDFARAAVAGLPSDAATAVLGASARATFPDRPATRPRDDALATSSDPTAYPNPKATDADLPHR